MLRPLRITVLSFLFHAETYSAWSQNRVNLPNKYGGGSLRGLLYVLFFWPGALAGFAHAQGVDAEDVVDKVIFDRQSSTLLVDYLQTHDMLSPAHGISVKIFTDGRVVVNLPSIHPRAGAYELLLSNDEVDRLVASIVESNVETELSTQSAPLTYISDSTRTRVSLFANGFSLQSGVTTSLSGPIVIKEADLNARSIDMRRSRINQVEQQLLALTKDTRLRRM